MTDNEEAIYQEAYYTGFFDALNEFYNRAQAHPQEITKAWLLFQIEDLSEQGK